MNISNFIQELRRRNVFKVATAYTIASWLLAQIANVFEEALELPTWFDSVIVSTLILGFPIALIFAWAFELTPEGLKKSKEVEITQSVTSRTGKKLNGIIITVLSMAVIFLLIERVFFAKASILEDAQQSSTIETASIAVLPFVNMSGDAENEYFSDGLSEELLNALAKIEDMKVAGRTSSFKFKGLNEDLKIVGEQLGVEHILEGSVRKAGGRVRITAQLIKVDDGFHMWSETFDRELTVSNIFEIQEEISRKVLSELKVRLLPDEDLQLENIPTQDIEAYQAYLKGNQLLLNRNYDEIEASIALYNDAIRLDPSFASAFAQLAIAYNLQAYYGNIPLETLKVNMKPNIDRALAIDSELAEGYAALGLYYSNIQDNTNAAEAYTKSLRLNPNQADVYNWLGNTYQNLGDRSKQMDLYSEGYEIDPLNPLAIYNRIRVSLDVNDFEEADVFMEKNIRINPDFIPTYYLKGNIQFAPPFGQFDEAAKLYTQVYNSDNDFPRAISLLIFTSQVLDMPKLADHYYEILKENYRDSFEYRGSIGFYERNNKEYKDYQTIQLPYLEKSENLPSDPFTYFDLHDYAISTGEFEKVIPIFKRFDEGLFSDTLTVINERNSSQGLILANLLKKKGDLEQASILTKAFCDYTERSIAEYINGKDDVRYQNDYLGCIFLLEDYDLFTTELESLYKENRDISTAYYYLSLMEDAYPELYSDELQALHKELIDELSQQRANFISYLKAEGDWREDWDTTE